MKVELDRQHDAAYFAFTAAASVRQVKMDNARIIDYAADGSVVGVEFISPSRGVNLAGVPRAAEIEREARRLGLPIRTVPADVVRPGRGEACRRMRSIPIRTAESGDQLRVRADEAPRPRMWWLAVWTRAARSTVEMGSRRIHPFAGCNVHPQLDT